MDVYFCILFFFCFVLCLVVSIANVPIIYLHAAAGEKETKKDRKNNTISHQSVSRFRFPVERVQLSDIRQ